MSIKINYSNKKNNVSSSNTVLFCDEKYGTTRLKKYISASEFSYISDLTKTIDSKKIYLFLILIQKKR
tara:strand:- start:3 stop:206 length:204 start_codon:yes stop_codon:yes gene_type:complete